MDASPSDELWKDTKPLDDVLSKFEHFVRKDRTDYRLPITNIVKPAQLRSTCSEDPRNFTSSDIHASIKGHNLRFTESDREVLKKYDVLISEIEFRQIGPN